MKRTLYALLALIVVGSIALAYNQDNLQGAFNLKGTKNLTSTSILHISSTAAADTSLYWDNAEVTLGEWKVKADQNLTLSGPSFYIGAVSNLGSAANNFLPDYFEDCSLEVKTSSAVVATLTSTLCSMGYDSVSLEAGKTYTFTLKAKTIGDSLEEFLNESLNGEETVLSLTSLTKSDGTTVNYNESNFTAWIEQEASSSLLDPATAKTINFEYTYGGYTLQSQVAMANGGPTLTPVTDELIIEQTYTKQTNTNTITPVTPNFGGSIKVTVPSGNAVTEDLTLTISAGGSTVKITDGSTTKTCTSSTTGNYSCQIP